MNRTASNRGKTAVLSSFRCALKHIPTSARSHPSFLEWWALKIAHFCGKRDITQLHLATPHIDRISPFQVHRIYQETPLQYFPNTWVSAPCSDISRCRNCPQNLPMAQIPPAFILPLLNITTFDHTQISLLPVPKFQPASGKPRPRAGVLKFLFRPTPRGTPIGCCGNERTE